MERHNLHTHTYLCKHAEGNVDDYCKAAIDNGLTILGFSDHTPHVDGRWIKSRMALDEFPQYVADVREAQRQYADKMTILLGLEYEYLPAEKSFVEDELFGKYAIDYLIGAVHDFPMPGAGVWNAPFNPSDWFFYRKNVTPQDLCSMTDYILASMETRLFIYFAHPDMFGIGWRGWDETATDCARAICQASNAYDIPLEINAYGIRKPKVIDNDVERWQYPMRRFWEIAGEEGVTAVIGADAHRPQDVWGGMEIAEQFAVEYGIKLVDAAELVR